MIVGTQELKPGSFNRHLVALSHKKASRRKNIIVGLTLTSMVDMFSLLVIFLLQTFSAAPELMAITKGVALPNAMTGIEIKSAPLLSISDAKVFLDQKEIGNTPELLKDPSPLMDALAELRDRWQTQHPSEKFPGEINLQADRELSSALVSKFMAMLPSQAYGSVQLVVVNGKT